MQAISPNTFTEIYRKLKYSISDSDRDLSALVEQGIMVKTDSYLGYTKEYYVSPRYVIQIIAGTPSDEFGRYISIFPELLYDGQWDFATALHMFLTKGTIEEGGFDDCDKFFNYIYDSNIHGILRIVDTMLESDRFTPFFKSCGIKCYRPLSAIAIKSYECMMSFDSDLHNSYLYFTEGSDVFELDSLVYVLHNELMINGHLDDLIVKYKDTPAVAEYLAAIKGIYDKCYTPIYDLTLSYLRNDWIYALEEPHMVMFLFGALLKDTSEVSMKLALKLSKKREVKRTCFLLDALLSWKINGSINQRKISILSQSYYNPGTHVVFTLFADYCHMFVKESDIPYFVDFYRKNILTTSKMTYVKLLYAEADDKADSSLIDTLRESTGMHSFLSDGQRKEKWQVMLENIRRQIQVKDMKDGLVSSSASRIAYLVDPDIPCVRPIVQKTSNGTTWTKGRNVALSSLCQGIVDGFTERDRKVAATVREERTWSGTSYFINHRQAIVALVGNPYVFTDDANRLKVEIYSQPLELSVTKDKKGNFSFRFNVNPDQVDKNNVYIDTSNPCSIRVVELKPNQMYIIRQLIDFGKLPAKAASELADTLAVLGKEMTVMSDLVKQDGDVRVTDGSAVMVVQLIPDGDSIHAQVFAKPLSEYPPYLTPGKGSEFVSARVDNAIVQTKRDIHAENANFEEVEHIMHDTCGNQLDDTQWSLSIDETLDVLAAIAAIPDKAAVEWPEGVKMKVTGRTLVPGDFHIKVKNVENWFEVEGKAEVSEGVSMKIADILEQLQHSHNHKFIRLNDSEYVKLSDHLASVLKQLSQTSQKSARGKNVRMSKFNALTLDELENTGIDLKGDRAYRHIIKLINQADTAVIRMPRNLQADLRDYQKEGYKWMARLRMWGAGACLADDMGLGKTLQTIALLLSLRADGPSLVVAPASVITNWKDEILRFAPALKPVVLNAAPDAARAEIIANAGKGDILITSYGLLVTREDDLCGKEWNVAVLDEAHTIKNRGTKMSKSAMKLKASMRVALTGTPLQNRLSEIWNIFQFINPGLLGSFESFTEHYINPIERDGDKDRQRVLKRLISPFLLRRTKNDVLNELPEKSEITLRIDLSEEERAIYERLRREAELSVESGDGTAMQMLAQLTRLRQAACDPRLIYPDIKIESSKAVAFMSLVEDLMSSNHRALVFSQFTSHLDLIKQKLDQKHIPYLYLDGATPAGRRAQLVEEFQNGDTPLFLISLKAGGLGLNLTAADYVIHLDPWWNPAIEDQASDRSYRMGQQKPVTVYRLIAADTIEEKILRLHKFKKSLADALLEGSDMSARLTKEDILNLLKSHGS